MQSLFPLDEKFLFAIIRLEDSNSEDWKTVRDKISAVADEITQTNLHGFPDSERNYSERFNFLRGFSAGLDVLKNIFKNPSQLRTELQEQDEVIEAAQRASLEEGAEG